MKKQQSLPCSGTGNVYKLLVSKLGLLMLISIFSISQVFAQQRKTITGKVIDSSNYGLPGVSIVVKGTATGTISNADGAYSIEVPANAKTLVFSFIGLKTSEMSIGNQTRINVTMVDDAIGIDELVVVGFGTQKKATLTGAVSQVSGSDIMKGKGSSSAALALQGEVAGVIVTRTSSRPGNEDIGIKIRGDISVNSVSPLILLDGLEIPDWQLSTINANDIETYSVLKDGAAAIYGTKAAGGVILVTTKKGKKGAIKVNYKGELQMNYANDFPVANMNEWAQLWLTAGDNDAIQYTDINGLSQMAASNYRFFTRPELLQIIDGTFPMAPESFTWNNKVHRFADTNQFDAVYGTTASQRHDLSVSGGNDKATYRSSLGYSNERSPIDFVYDGAKKYNFRTNVTYQVSDLISTEFNVSYDNRLVDEPTQGVGFGVQDMYIFPLYNPQGQYYDNFGGNNLLAKLDEGGRTKTKEEIFRLGGKITLDLNKYIKGLSFNYNGNVSSRGGLRSERTTSVTMYDWDGNISYTPTTLLTSGIKLFETKVFFQNHVAQANYVHSFDKHNLGFMAGATAEMQQTNKYFQARTNMASDDMDDILLGDVTTQVTGAIGNYKQSNDKKFNSGSSAVGLVSYIGKINYDYSGIYLLEALGRRDGSSRLHPDVQYRWNNFYSASGGVRLSEISVIKDLGIFDNLKLRASYGETGATGDLGEYDYISSIAMATTQFGSSPSLANTSYVENMTDYNRSWERVNNTNYAIDFAFLNNRLSGTAELYNRRNVGMLISVTYPQVIGATAPKTNSGDFTTNGWEFSLNWKDKVGDFKYNFGLMLWDSRSEVTRMEGAITIKNGTNTAAIEGKPLNAIYTYKTDGYLQTEEEVLAYYNAYGFADAANQTVLKTGTLLPKYRSADRLTPGCVKRVDVSGDGIISTDDMVYQGDANAHNSFGINLGAEYKGIDFSAFFQGVGEQNIVRTGALAYPLAQWWTNQNPTYIGQTWTADNTDAIYPISTYNGARKTWNYGHSNDVNIVHAAYCRAKVITLGYSLPKSLIAKAGVERVRFSITGNDLFVISNVKDGMDPEMKTSAAQGSTVPYNSTVLFGIDVTF